MISSMVLWLIFVLWPLSYAVAAELRVNKSHLWQYLAVGLGEDFYLTDAEMETLRGNFQAIYDSLPQSNGSDLLPQFLSRVSFDLSETMYVNHGDACSWDFADRRISCKSDWFRTTKTIFGDCFTFNYDGRFKQVGRGPGNGLRLIMNVHNDVNSGRYSSISIQNVHIDSSWFACKYIERSGNTFWWWYWFFILKIRATNFES